MIIRSYFDESGTHEGSPITVMGAVSATVEQWAKFERRFAMLQDWFGFQTFHTRKFKAKSGDFVGWSDAKCRALIEQLLGLTSSGLMAGTVFLLSNEDYGRLYRNRDTPPKVRLDSKYGLAFRHCLRWQLIDIVERLPHDVDMSKVKVHVVLERGHKNAGDAARAFGEEVSELRSLGLTMLDTLTLADKAEPPLMIADMLAHMGFMRGGLPESDAPPPAPKETTGLSYVGFEEGGLADCKNELIQRLAARRAYAASRRAAPTPGNGGE